MKTPIVIKDNQSSDLQLRQRQEDIVTARNQIKNAFQATMFIGGISTLFWLAEISRGVPGAFWSILDVILIFGLGYGISRNKEICAKIMFLYFLAGKLFQAFSGHLPPAGVPLSGILLYYLWNGMVGTTRYHQLMQEEEDLAQLIAVATPPDRGRSPEPSRTISTPAEPLNPTPELLSLCGGDRVQAQWLLSQVKIKHPERSLDWYNRQAIYRLTTKTAAVAEQSNLTED